MKKILLLAAVVIVGLASCKKGPNEITPDKLKAILLGKDTLIMYPGQVRQITITVTPSDYDENSLIWNSSDTSVITVNNSGTVSAKAPGTSKISVSNHTSTVSISCLVSVIPRIDSLKIGLIAYYPFNNSPIDSSGNGNNGTVYNVTSTTNRFVKANSAYQFDGTTSYITVPDNQPLRLNATDFTLNAWIKIDTYNSFFLSSIWDKRLTGADNGWSLGVQGSSATPVGSVNFGPGGGSSDAVGNIAVAPGYWTMITCIYKLSTTQLSIYINGTLDNTTSSIISPNATINTLLYIGKDNPSVPNNGYFFQGSMDELRMYNRALPNSQIQKLYHLPY